MAEPSSPTSEQTRTQRVVNEALRTRTAIIVSSVALLGAGVSLAKTAVGVPAVAAALGFVALLLLLAQIAGRSFLMQLGQNDMLLRAVDELEIIRRNTEEELRVEERQTKQLELLFTAMREFNLIQVKSLDALSESRPTTSFYLQRHAAAIVEILEGRWDRSEFLRPEQLWREYGELVTRMKQGETFRSTVCLPEDPALLFDDDDFHAYVTAIYKAARSGRVHVKRLFVLNCKEWPPNKELIEPEVIEHLRALDKVESALATDEDSPSTLEARVTNKANAVEHLHLNPPDFMLWGDGLLIQSDLDGPNGLVTRADFYFSSNSHSKEISKRQGQFDVLFANAKLALPLASVV